MVRNERVHLDANPAVACSRRDRPSEAAHLRDDLIVFESPARRDPKPHVLVIASTWGDSLRTFDFS